MAKELWIDFYGCSEFYHILTYVNKKIWSKATGIIILVKFQIITPFLGRNISKNYLSMYF